ncbi:tyrosine-type recombinase/integrase [Microbacterium sp. AG1240]|uniref:tyrosine-type recombinase/integrase n=1 Tax=Microbacterium sp. AG1240 TaxID=2183992 RepID=UPI00160299A8|nr:tyrosine-type recombinase/integrase [Microbacterium sp. AG1240]
MRNLLADLRQRSLEIAQGPDRSGDDLTVRRTGRSASAVTVSQLCEIHLAHMEFIDNIRMAQGHHINRGTRGNETRIIRNKIMPSRIGSVVATTVTVQDVSDFYFSIALKAPSEARNAQNELRKVFDTARQKGLVSSNPARDFRGVMPRKPVNKFVPGPLELRDFFDVAVAYRERPNRMGPEPSRDLEDLIEVVLGTSARLGEALGLHWVDVRLEADVPTVSIRGTVQEKGGPKFYQPHTKTEAGQRTVPIPDFLVQTLRRRATENTMGSPFVFHTKTGRVSGQQDLQRSLRAVRKWSTTSDLVPTVSVEMVPRALRRSVATAISNEESLEAAAKTLGHRETGVTENSYAKRSDLAPDVRHVLDGLAPWYKVTPENPDTASDKT